MIKVENAIILAAGCASRFAPLSFEKPKSLYKVKGEVLLERLIKQLKEKNINNIYIIVGYLHEQFKYLEKKFGVKLIINKEYKTKNNYSSILAASKCLNNSYICVSDIYYKNNLFNSFENYSFYSGEYSTTEINEWIMHEDDKNYISNITVGGQGWYMLGHAFVTEKDANSLLKLINDKCNEGEDYSLYWEDFIKDNLNLFKFKINKIQKQEMFEFDTLNDLRKFDQSYANNSNSKILKSISQELNVCENDINPIKSVMDQNEAIGFIFDVNNKRYYYKYKEGIIYESEE